MWETGIGFVIGLFTYFLYEGGANYVTPKKLCQTILFVSATYGGKWRRIGDISG